MPATELATFRVGDLEVKAFNDGILKTSLDLVIGMDRAIAESLAGPTDNGSLFIPVNNFVFVRDGKTIMIDAGAGNTMQPTLGKLPENLRAGGIDPAAITHILLTHIHPDHANGLVDDAGQPHYPNAEILVHETEMDFWLGESLPGESELTKRMHARARIDLKPYMNRIRRMRDGAEYLGCGVVLASGHSPGHTVWRIDGGGEAFISWGDLVHLSAIQISHPDAALAYDLDKDQAIQSRKRILDMAASERFAIAGAHVNAPGFGYVVRKGASFAFEPAGN
jgi:glyoxylase-like metal-dependent hydrolase (beta-lactamase superfamily II)